MISISRIFCVVCASLAISLIHAQTLVFQAPWRTGESWMITKGSIAHTGIDLLAEDFNYSGQGQTDYGRPILFIADITGAVVKQVKHSVNKAGDGYGNYVDVGFATADGKRHVIRFAHLATVTVAVGQTISLGDQIGLCGKSGTDSTHLHIAHYTIKDGRSDDTRCYSTADCDPQPLTDWIATCPSNYDGVVCTSSNQFNPSVDLIPVGYAGTNIETDFDHDISNAPTSKNALIAQAHARATVQTTNKLTLIPTDDTNHPNSRFLHCWLKSDQSCSGFWIQNHHNINREKRGANVYREGNISAHTIRAGFWDVFSNFGGPNEVNGFGYPISDEVPDKPNPYDTGATAINCSNAYGDNCPAIQYFYKNGRQSALVYNPNWPPGDYPLGVVRLCPSSTCPWQPNVDHNSFSVAPVYMAGAWSGDGIGGGSSNLTLKPSYISYDRVDFDVTNTGGLALDDLALIKDGQQISLFAPGAASTPMVTGLNSGTTYTFQLQGLMDDWGSVIESDPVEVTTLPAPSTTLKLVSGIAAVNEQFPDAFHLGSCITVTYQVENTGSSTIAIEQLRAEAEIYDGSSTYTRDFDHLTGSPLVNLAPGQRYTYTGDNCDNPFPSDYHPDLPGSPVLYGKLRPRVKVMTVPAIWDITDVQEGSKWLNFKLYDTFDLPELHQTGIRVSPERLQSHLWTSIDFDITNTGPYEAQYIQLEVVVDGIQTYTREIRIIPAHSTVTDGVQPGFLSEGVHHIAWTVDKLNNAKETDETNNAGSFFITVGFPDYDDDAIPDATDNCRYTPNADQLDTDADGKGNVCDNCPIDPANDADMDGYCANLDNCPTITNFYQENADGDAFGNACDACPYDASNDADMDGVCGDVDNCPTVTNANQQNTDTDSHGDACDNCVYAANEDQSDSNRNGVGDACDTQCTQMKLIGTQYQLTTGYSESTAVAWDGTGFGVSFTKMYNGWREIVYSRRNSSGAELVPAKRITTKSADSFNGDMVWNGTEYGLIWRDRRDNDYELYFTRLSVNGTQIGNQIRLTNAPGDALYPSITWSGSTYGITWGDYRNGISQIYFMRVDRYGTKLGSELRVTNTSYLAYDPSIAWNGTEYGISWTDARHGAYETYFARINANGSKIGSDIRITNDTYSSSNPSLVWDGANYAVTWVNWLSSASGYAEIYFVRFTTTGTKIGTDKRVTNAANRSTNPSMDWNGSAFGIVWEDERDGNYEIYFAQVDRNGTKLGSDLRVSNTAKASFKPSIAWNGKGYGVAWEDQLSSYTILFQRVGCN